jgi:hypothetical protein
MNAAFYFRPVVPLDFSGIASPALSSRRFRPDSTHKSHPSMHAVDSIRHLSLAALA